MRLWPFFFVMLAGSLAASELAPTPAYPPWNGQESVAQYARRVNLPPTQSLDLGGGVKLDLMLIPAGQFIMGTPEPPQPKETVQVGQTILGLGGALALGLLIVILLRGIKESERPKFSLRWLLLLVLALSVALCFLGMPGPQTSKTVFVLMVLAGAATLGLLMVIAVRVVRMSQRPKFSLRWLLLLVFALSIGLYGGVRWYKTKQAWLDYQAAKARYDAAYKEEKPGHPVTLTQPFYMGKYDVTQEQYQQVIGTNPSNFKGKDNPVETVSWDDAQKFCEKLSELSHQAVRLPTEAEWEYGCRAGTTTTYYSGDTDKDLDRVAWYGANSKSTTHPVGQKEPNVFGLYDMHGNIWQWCQDFYGEDYYGKSEAENPQGPTQGAFRVLRGGSWYGGPVYCRSAGRFGSGPGGRSYGVGFRVALAPAFRTP